MTVSPRSLPLLAALLVVAALPLPTAAAIEDGVIIPQVDPHPSEGYVDVYYHNCPVLGDEPCSHHHVGRVQIPCVAPSAAGTGASRVVLSNCGQTLVDQPVCAPTPSTSQTTTTITLVVAGCGVGPYTATVCKPNPGADVPDLAFWFTWPVGCWYDHQEPSGPWATVTPYNGGYKVDLYDSCDYRTSGPRCYYPWWSVCLKATASATPTPTYAVGDCSAPMNGCLTYAVTPGDPITYAAGPCGSPATGTQCVPKAGVTDTSTTQTVTVSCGATTQSATVCKANPGADVTDLAVWFTWPVGCWYDHQEPSGPWATVTPYNGGYKVDLYDSCDYRTSGFRCYYPWWSMCVKATAAPDLPNRRATLTYGDCNSPAVTTVEAPCLVTTVTPHSDLRGVTYNVGPCASPLSGSQRVDDLPSTPGPWLQVGSGGKYPGAILWAEVYTDCTHDLDNPTRPTCGGSYVPVTLGPYP